MGTVPIQLIVGLGNPGAEYERARHNAGVWILERLAHLAKSSLVPDRKFLALISRANLFKKSVYLLFPTTFMNNSGASVQSFAHYYKIPPQAILVIHDDLDLPPGTIKLKQGGGHGGHNGLRDIIQLLGSRDFVRLRVGIGHPTNHSNVVDYVLKPPTLSEKSMIDESIDRAMPIFPDIITGNLSQAMQALHTEIAHH
ncbi:MAG: aminoacyl-tRNA hydrolase [Gammaproteobacteria bacterium GWF2_41_13]|nr:MAG: aminoacyl-tRNA hydrolase [Gammaproteobacteria bacterium GWF2_41_13]